MNEERINQMSPLTWAYVGDSVFELYVREHLTESIHAKPNRLHREAIKYVKAKAQAEILNRIHDSLTDEEQEIVRRTRNTENHHLPKNAELKDYMYATAFEGLIGYLYLTAQEERLKEILDKCINGPLVKRLRRHPLKVEAWVRFPYGSPHKLCKPIRR